MYLEDRTVRLQLWCAQREQLSASRALAVTAGGVTLLRLCRDTAGQERFRTITSSYYRGAHGVVLIYDPTSEHARSSMQRWPEILDRYRDERSAVAILVNKMDLADEKTNALEFLERAKAVNYGLFAGSCKNNEGLDEMWTALIRNLIRIQKVNDAEPVWDYPSPEPPAPNNKIADEPTASTPHASGQSASSSE